MVLGNLCLMFWQLTALRLVNVCNNSFTAFFLSTSKSYCNIQETEPSGNLRIVVIMIMYGFTYIHVAIITKSTPPISINLLTFRGNNAENYISTNKIERVFEIFQSQ